MSFLLMGQHYTKDEQVAYLLYEIEMRSCRHRRASESPELLRYDLEAIEKMTCELREVLASEKQDYYR